MGNRVRHANLKVEVLGDETARHVGTMHDGRGQVQIGAPDDISWLHLSGTPASWRHLAKVIEDAAMDLEGQIAEQAAESGVRT